MQELKEQLLIAEKYLDEMLEAEKTNDYEAWITRFEEVDLLDFNKDMFEKDISEMNEKMGAYKTRSFLETLRSAISRGDSESHKFVWKGVYEKTDVIMIVGIHKKNDIWHVHQYTINY